MGIVLFQCFIKPISAFFAEKHLLFFTNTLIFGCWTTYYLYLPKRGGYYNIKCKSNSKRQRIA